MVKKIPELMLPLDLNYLVIEIDGCETGWGGALFRKTSKYDPKSSESLYRYASGKYKEKGHITSLDYEILAIIYCLNAFMFFICTKNKITIRTDYEAIIKYGQQTKGLRKSLSARWWINLQIQL